MRWRSVGEMTVTVDQIREFAGSLPRSYEAIVHGRLKFRIGQIVYLSIATDGSASQKKSGRRRSTRNPRSSHDRASPTCASTGSM